MIKKSCLFCFIATSLLASCGNSSVDNSKLVIGMECSYQPFNWTINESNEYSLPIDGTNQFADGYDISVAKYLGKTLNKEVIIKKITWENLIPSLLNDNINMILAGMSVTSKRLETISFSDAYLSSDLAFLIKSENLPENNSKENPLSYEKLLNLFKDKNLICQSGVVGDDIIETYFSSKTEYNIVHNSPLATYPLAAQDVKNGGAFAMPAELPVVEAMTNLGGLSVLYCDYKSFLSNSDITGLSVNVGIKKGNTDLKNEINTALKSLSEQDRNKMMAEASLNIKQLIMISFEKIKDILSRQSSIIWAGIFSTIILSIVGTVIGLLLGIFLAYGKKIKINIYDKPYIKILKKIVIYLCSLYSLFFRGTPMMVQALIFKYSFQAMGVNFENIRFSPSVSNVLNGWLIAGLIVITINTAAYMCEIVISGFNGIDNGQIEGAKALGLSPSQTSFFIVLPQAIKNVLPTIGNELIVNIKDSSVLNVIAVSELYYRMHDIATTNYAFLESYVILAIIYFIMTLIASIILKLIEKKLDGQKISLNPFGRFIRWRNKHV